MQASRILNKAMPDHGGWSTYFSWIAGAECANPAGHKFLDCSGAKASPGWPDAPAVQPDLDDWFAAARPEDELAAASS